MKATKPTVQDIATMAGVSTATVSMILNKRTGVSFSPETIQRVNDAADQLGYVRGGVQARHPFLKSTVLVICPTITNAYYSDLIHSIEQAANASGYHLLLYTTYRDPDREARILDSLSALCVAGVAFLLPPQNPRKVAELSKSFPMVVIGDHAEQTRLDTVELNNYRAGKLLARHLIELGHKHIAYLSTTLDQYNTARTRRLDGLRDTYAKECPEGSVLVQAKRITPEMDLEQIQVEYAAGVELTRQCLGNEAITAFVAVNDMVAFGVMDTILQAGMEIPGHYSVCGFDNLAFSGLQRISLTSVEHHIIDKGHSLFEMLHAKITKGDRGAKAITRVEYQPRLIVRGSTAPPRKG